MIRSCTFFFSSVHVWFVVCVHVYVCVCMFVLQGHISRDYNSVLLQGEVLVDIDYQLKLRFVNDLAVRDFDGDTSTAERSVY